LPKLPSTLEQLQLALEQKQITNIHIPIWKHHNIQLVMETLRQNFAYYSLPEYIFDLIDLPEPSFEIFDLPKQITTTYTQISDIEEEDNMDYQ
jgi:hypothetical protein